jgi:transposase
MSRGMMRIEPNTVAQICNLPPLPLGETSRRISRIEPLNRIGRWHGYWQVSKANATPMAMKKQNTTITTNTHNVTKTPETKKFTKIQLGVDVHADSYRVVRQIDAATPQPAQKMTPVQFLSFAAKQLTLAQEVYSSYEAGPFGYGLHRALVKMGIKNVVVRPQNWDELGRGVKTDKTDALALVQRLDRYVQGNTKALAVITVPTEEQELQRAASRHREQLQKDRQTHEAQGRSLLLYLGRRVKGQWWQERVWNTLQRLLEPRVAQILENLRVLILAVDKLLGQTTLEIQSQAKPQPKGFGLLTSEVLRREVGDYSRFTNRRQVASLSGTCPGVFSTGKKCVFGPITKHGNPRIRRALIELAWRVARFQPNYPPVVKWRKALTQRQARGLRKKAIVAIARHLIIDQWRLETGRGRAADLHLI